MINELAIHMSHCFGMIKLGIIYLLPKYFDYNPLNIILKRLIKKTPAPVFLQTAGVSLRLNTNHATA